MVSRARGVDMEVGRKAVLVREAVDTGAGSGEGGPRREQDTEYRVDRSSGVPLTRKKRTAHSELKVARPYNAVYTFSRCVV